MILQSLAEYYEQLLKQGKVSVDGWSIAKVSFALTIDYRGELKSIIPLFRTETRGKREVLLPVERTVPFQKNRASQIAPHFLCDNAKYLLGAWQESQKEDPEERIKENEKNKKKAESYFEKAGKYHMQLLEKSEYPLAQGICRFFQTWDFERDKEKLEQNLDELLAASNLVFRSYEETREVLDDQEIKRLWNSVYGSLEESELGRCLVTGKETSITRLHPLVKGVKGAQSSGAALVSFNGSAFESYGKEQGANAPVSGYVAKAYGKALNYLLSQKKHTRIMGDTTVVFWAETGEEGYSEFMSELFGDVEEDMEDKLLSVMDSIAKGKPCKYQETELHPETNFYILGLSPNAARLSVRIFYRNTFGEVINNINAHYQRLQIVRPKYEKREYPSVNDILYETVNQKSTTKKPQSVLTGAFLRSVLEDSKYPEVLYTQILIRIRADRKINRNRAAMLKAFIMKNFEKNKEVVGAMELNEQSENTAYTLGRIFAVLEHVQNETNPGINTTIKDQYFNSACATPAVVFPRLLKLKNNHTRVLGRDKKGMQITLEKELGSLMDRLHEGFPKQLSLEEQGIFIIGYYHQVQRRYQKAEEQ